MEMIKSISISLLTILVYLLVPWQLICLSHPSGHNHHHEGNELSSCEQRRASLDTRFWPPMDCFRMDLISEEYLFPITQKQRIVLLQCNLVNLVPLDTDQELKKKSNLLGFLPDSNADPPPQSNPYRGPPSV
jgi:hypothetical protein